MIRKLVEENKMQIMKRLTAILVAVVFVFGTTVIPAEIYGTETDLPAAGDQVTEAVETVTPEAGQTAADEDTPADADADAVAEESQEAETPEVTDDTDIIPMDEVVKELNEVVSADLDSIDESEYDGFLYKLEDDITKKEIREMENAIGELDEGQEVEEVISNELYSADSLETIGEVATVDQIECIEPNYILTACASPNDSFYNGYGWYLRMINAPYVWDRNMFGSGTVVAVLDSGVKTNHEDFASTVFVDKYNAITGTTDVTDNVGHGTAVAGIIAASYNNNRGLTGVMPQTKVMPVKILEYNDETDETEGDLEDVIRGIDYAVDHGADVINISAGGTRYSSLLRDACRNAANRDVIIVAAAGNEAQTSLNGIVNPIEYPASYDTVVSVGSIERDGAHSDFSNYNQYVAVTAPGRSIAVPWIPFEGYNYVLHVGTSFSAPQVAAMAAMIKSMDSSADYESFMDIIRATSADKGPAGRDNYFGYGLMDLSKAYLYMCNDISAHSADLSSSSYVYDGGAKTPSVTVKHLKKKLTEGTDYTVSYAAGRTAVGTYNVTVGGKGEYTGTKTVSFRINPPLVKAIKAPKRGKGKLTVRWKALSKKQKKKTYKNVITGYQVRVSTNQNFVNAKYASVKGIAKTSKTVKRLKRKTTYYVQYRAYKTVGNATYYSNWSGTKKAKTK